MRRRGTIGRTLVAIGMLVALGAPPALADHDDDRYRHGHRRHRHHREWNEPQARFYYYQQPGYYYEPRREYYYDAPRVYVPPPPVPSFGLNLVFPIH